MTNFKIDIWKGSLLELFEECFNFGPSDNQIIKADEWIHKQLNNPENVFPIRKYAEHGLRGEVFENDNKKYLAVDNEPLASLFKIWKDNSFECDKSIADLLNDNSVKASWKCDYNPKPEYKFGGVKTSFRDVGLKLAHIEDAGKLNANVEIDIKVRYLRTLLPSNIFLFPSHRISTITVEENSNYKNKITRADWAECAYIRSLAKGWLTSKLSLIKADYLLKGDELLKDVIKIPVDWKDQANNLKLTCTPRIKNFHTPESKKKSSPKNKEQKNTNTHSLPRISKKCAEEMGLENVIDTLKKYRLDHPNDLRLGSNSNPWVYLPISGFQSPQDDFTCKTNITFKGEIYNSTVNFHGDTKWKAIEDFLEAYDACEGDITDVLAPSATYEYNTLPRNKKQKPKFALNGYDGVGDFFLYHDNLKTDLK